MLIWPCEVRPCSAARKKLDCSRNSFVGASVPHVSLGVCAWAKEKAKPAKLVSMTDLTSIFGVLDNP